MENLNWILEKYWIEDRGSHFLCDWGNG